MTTNVVVVPKGTRELRKREWYNQLIEDCRDIKVERRWNIVNELLLCKMELGMRITQDMDSFNKYELGRGEALLTLSEDIEVSRREIYRMLLFYDKARLILEEKGGNSQSGGEHRIVEPES